jgi:hypothetical protein
MYELTGKLCYSLSFTAKGKPIVTLEMNEYEDAIKMVDELHDENLSIKIGKKKDGRSLDANSYYWLLLSRLAKKMGISNAYCHNLMLRRYGVLEDIDGQVVYWVIPDTDEASKTAEESETYHLKPTSDVREGKGGMMFRTYLLLKGSHDYTKEEFSHLINKLVEECKSVGIPTIRQEMIDSLLSHWGE